MGDILDKLEELVRYIGLNQESGTPEEVDLDQVAEWLAGAIDVISQGRQDLDRVVTRSATLQEEAVKLRHEIGQLQGVEADLRGELVHFRGKLAGRETDFRDAAGEVMVPVPEPGTDMAKLLSANVLLRRELADARVELVSQSEALASTGSGLALMRLVAAEAVAIIQRLYQHDGLDLEGDVLLLMARVRAGHGGGCGTCPLRETKRNPLSETSPLSTCGHPEILNSELVLPTMEEEVTGSQQRSGPPPRWCPLAMTTDHTAVYDMEALDATLVKRLQSLATSLRSEGRPVEGAVCDRAIHMVQVLRGDQPCIPDCPDEDEDEDTEDTDPGLQPGGRRR